MDVAPPKFREVLVEARLDWEDWYVGVGAKRRRRVKPVIRRGHWAIIVATYWGSCWHVQTAAKAGIGENFVKHIHVRRWAEFPLPPPKPKIDQHRMKLGKLEAAAKREHLRRSAAGEDDWFPPELM